MLRVPKVLHSPRLAAVAAGGALLAFAGCNLNKAEVPGLNGPSELAISFHMTASPDIITADGVSTSSIQVLARDENGRPLGGQAITFALADGQGNFADIGQLSTTTATTGPNGIAQVIYRSPPRTDNTANRFVEVAARPITGDARGQLYRTVTIELRSAEPRLFPQIPGNARPFCNFVIEPATGVGRVNQDFLFQTGAVDSDGVIVRYEWDFGDGRQDDKPDVVHRYGLPGTYTVVHVVTDNGGLQSACQANVVVQ
jgi:hypothetical protein